MTTAGAFAGTRNLAGGLSTSGALTAWLKGLTGSDYPALLAEAEASGPGAHGVVLLPYFAGERTPIAKAAMLDGMSIRVNLVGDVNL